MHNDDYTMLQEGVLFTIILHNESWHPGEELSNNYMLDYEPLMLLL